MEWGTPEYMVREELQTEKLRCRTGKRAWGFKKRLEEGRGSTIAKKCWEKLRERALKRRGG